jgi:hypothetical protein
MRRATCACLLLLVSTSTASAANFTWTGASETSHRWSDSANWGGTAPSGTVGTLEFPELIAPACTANPATAACYETENDISAPSVNAITLDDHAPYSLRGKGIEIGAGGITASTTGSGQIPNIELPITLDASQTWSINGNNTYGGLQVGSITGSTDTGFDLALSRQAFLDDLSSIEAGPVEVTGANPNDSGEDAGLNGSINGSFNGSDQEPVNVSNVWLTNYRPTSESGPLTAVGAKITVGGSVGSGAKLVVHGGVTLDPATVLQFDLNGAEIRASGVVNLASAHLVLENDYVYGVCPVLTPGQKFTLITTTGSLAGTFAGVPNEGTIALDDCPTNSPQELHITYTANSVIATAIGSTFTWSGSGGAGATTWSTGANWAGDTAPSAGASVGILKFPELSGQSYLTTNDVSGLTVNQLQVENSNPVGISGQGFTLGAGGLSVDTPTAREAPVRISSPLNLSADQTWSVSGWFPEIELAGQLSGEATDLNADLDSHTALRIGDFLHVDTSTPDDELGDVTISGEEIASAGEVSKSFVYLPKGGKFNSSDGHRLTVDHIGLTNEGATGPLTLLDHSQLLFSGTETGPVTATGSLVYPLGTATLPSVTLDSNSALSFYIDGTVDGVSSGQGSSELISTGNVALGGSELGLTTFADAKAGECLPSTGHVYTLVSTTGTVTGTFSGIPNEAIVTTYCLDQEYEYRITYNTSTSPETITATDVTPLPPGSGSGDGSTGGSTTTGSLITGSKSGIGASSAGGASTGGKSPIISAKALTQVQKLAKALRTCKKEKPKDKRRTCEAQAKRRYKPKRRVKVKKR